MAANPALVASPDRQLVPAPFRGEHIALGRQGVELALDNVQTRGGGCVPIRHHRYFGLLFGRSILARSQMGTTQPQGATRLHPGLAVARRRP